MAVPILAVLLYLILYRITQCALVANPLSVLAQVKNRFRNLKRHVTDEFAPRRGDGELLKQTFGVAVGRDLVSRATRPIHQRRPVA